MRTREAERETITDMAKRSTPYLLWHAVDDAAQARPEHAACRFAGSELSYHDLALRTDLLAQSLIELKGGRGDRVGVMLTKSLETQIAIFGILKGGAVFVPIDPAAPAGRVRFILRDCSVRIIVRVGSAPRACEDIGRGDPTRGGHGPR